MTDARRINIIIQEGEGLTVEFKERFTPRIVEDMAAFANAKGGIIILGVRDDKTIIGEKLTNDLKARVNRTILYCLERTVPEIRQTSYLGSATQKTTQKTTQKILKLIAQNPRITRKDLAEQIGISTDGVKYHLNRMRKQNLIRRIGPDRGGRWEVVY